MIRAALLAGGAAGALALLAASVSGAMRPLVVWNTTASAPEGLYRVSAEGPLRVGDWLALRPPGDLGRWLSDRGYLPTGAVLVKQVAALAPSRVCRSQGRITADGRLIAHAAAVDRRQRALPVWSGCRTLGPSEVFLVNRAPGSLDSRYFGPLPRAAIVGQLTPIWTGKDHSHAP